MPVLLPFAAAPSIMRPEVQNFTVQFHFIEIFENEAVCCLYWFWLRFFAMCALGM